MSLKQSSNWRHGLVLLVMFFFFFTSVAGAQERSAGSDIVPADNTLASVPEKPEVDINAEANNPLANFSAFNIHNYYIGELTDRGDEPGNQAWLRYATPLKFGESLWIMRASLPLNTYPVAPTLEHESGIGDFNIFAAYLIDMGPGISFGVGPQLTVPTASQAALGSEKWSPGLVNILFNANSKKFQYGYLVSWSQSVAGKDERLDVNTGSFQPLLLYQLGGGMYLRSTAVMSQNFENGDYSIPVGLGIGKVFRSKNIIHNIFIEPQFSVAEEGAGWAKWQIFVGFNNQF
jgi:hypothetical protein